MTPPLIRGRIDDVRIPRIEGNITDTYIFADRENEFPVLTAVDCLIETTISTLIDPTEPYDVRILGVPPSAEEVEEPPEDLLGVDEDGALGDEGDEGDDYDIELGELE